MQVCLWSHPKHSPGNYLKEITKFHYWPHNRIEYFITDSSWPVIDSLALCYRVPMPGISATQNRQFFPFWGLLLLKFYFCSAEIRILVTLPTNPKFAFWSNAEYRPLFFSLDPGLRTEEQACIHGWGSVLPSIGPFAPFFVPLFLEG